ncbi:RNA polymerase sigma factor [Demequina salsinemoris]|uniref:RNA polymerase sigma factor n=1 Tax=Demequina salsinemoris TaxID=577470 RepID=UPI0007830064|nr:sigma-70 family RNA polymerase sigma factor [Demequina salsinemoris]
MVLGEGFDPALAAARTGAEWAWESLYRDLAGQVGGYLRSRGAQDPEDVLSETFLSVAKDIRRFEGDESDFRAWVFTIAHRRMQDAFRKRGRQVPTFDGEEALEAAAGAWLGNSEDEAMAHLSAAQVESIVRGLSDVQRDVLMLRVVGDLSVAETAQVLNRSEGAVKAIQSRALKVLRKNLSQSASPFRSDER